MRTKRILVCVCAAWHLSIAAAFAQGIGPIVSPPALEQSGPPTVIPVSGRLESAPGVPRTGTVSLKLSLYRAADDPNPMWTEEQLVLLDANGHYAIYFGATQPTGLPSELFAASEARWAGVAVAGEPEAPRTLVISVPYAAKASAADSIGGKRATDFVLSENLEGILTAWGVPVTRPTRPARPAPPGGGGGDSVTILSGSTTPNALVKFLDSGGTEGESAVYESGGNVGIGTSAPTERLHVTARGRFGDLTVGETQSGFTTIEDRGLNGLSLMPSGDVNMGLVIRKDGKVGIGTLNPYDRFHVAARSRLGAVAVGETQWGGFGSVEDFGTAGLALLSNGTAEANGVFITEAGLVGVGTAAPADKLHVLGGVRVTGNITLDGNINAKYQDVAEWVDAVEPLAAATVVTADLKTANRVRESAKAYDTAVLGVVSSQPGVLLGEPGAGKVAVAQSGRVKVKVDARYGAIRPGDLLVTSPVAGYAMRSRPLRSGIHRPGTIIGKALESMPKGKGEILVLLTLQ